MRKPAGDIIDANSFLAQKMAEEAAPVDAASFLAQKIQAEQGPVEVDFMDQALELYDQLARAPLRQAASNLSKGEYLKAIYEPAQVMMGERKAPTAAELVAPLQLSDQPILGQIEPPAIEQSDLSALGEAPTPGIGLQVAKSLSQVSPKDVGEFIAEEGLDITNIPLGGAGKLSVKATEGILNAAGKLADAAKGFKEERAFATLGPYPYTMKSGKKVKITPKESREIAATLLDEGIVGKGAKLQSYEQLQDAVDLKRREAADDLSQIIESLDSFSESIAKNPDNLPAASGKFTATNQARVGVDTDTIIEAVKKEMAGDINPRLDDSKALAQIVKTRLDNFKENNPGFITLKDAEILKRSYSNRIDFRKNPKELTINEKVDRVLYDVLQKGAEDGAELLSKFPGAPVTREQFVAAKKRYGKLRQAQDIVSVRSAGEVGVLPTGLMDKITGVGAAGAAAGIVNQMSGSVSEQALALGALGFGASKLNKFARKYGPQIEAKGADIFERSIRTLTEAPMEQVPMAVKPVAALLRSSASTTVPMAGLLGVRAALQNPETKKAIDQIRKDEFVMIDPADKGELMASIFKLDTLNNIDRAKMIQGLNKNRLYNYEALFEAPDDEI